MELNYQSLEFNLILQYTLEYLINVHNGKLFSYGLQKKDKLMLFSHFKAFSINLNDQHVNGMTHFDFTLCSRKDTMFESFLKSLIVQPGTPGIFLLSDT